MRKTVDMLPGPTPSRVVRETASSPGDIEGRCLGELPALPRRMDRPMTGIRRDRCVHPGPPAARTGASAPPGRPPAARAARTSVSRRPSSRSQPAPRRWRSSSTTTGRSPSPTSPTRSSPARRSGLGGAAARYDEGLIGSRGLMDREMSLIRPMAPTSWRRRPASRTIPASSRSSGVPRLRASRSRSSATGSASSSRLRSSGSASRSCRSSAPGRRSPRAVRRSVPERPPGLLRVRDVQAPAVTRPAGRGPCRRVHRRRRERSVCGRLCGRCLRQAAARADLPRERLAIPALDRVRRDPRLVEPDPRCLATRSGSAVVPRPEPRPFFCGPEVWGEGRTDPPALTRRQPPTSTDPGDLRSGGLSR